MRKITVDQLQQHNAVDDMWMVLCGKVYNVTPYISYHPGGASILLKGAGKDGTLLFNAIHPFVNIDVLIGNLCVGVIG